MRISDWSSDVCSSDLLIEEVDLVLVMSVNPGFGGQRFIDSQLRKIEAIRRMIDKTGKAIDLEVDGGIDRDTAPRAIAAGANVLVAGTATFKDRKSTRLNSSHQCATRMPYSA